MAPPIKKFVVRSADAIVLGKDEEAKRRQERLRSHFTDLAPKSTMMAVASNDVPSSSSCDAQLRLPPPITRNSALLTNFVNVRDTARHAKVVNDLLLIEPPEPEQIQTVAPVLQGSDSSSKETSPIVMKPSASNALLISHKQKGNPVIKFLRNVRLEYTEMIPDYVLGRTTCALFLSLRYHALHPDYIHDRLKLLGKAYELRVLLVLVDTKDPHHSLKELTKIAVLADCTLLLAWSPEEAAKHLETYKIFENKPPEILMKKQESDSYSKIIDALSSVRTINKSDAVSLMSTFETFENIVKASKEDLEVCPGMGPKKARDLYSVLHKPFLK